jgi:hypothetical protein
LPPPPEPTPPPVHFDQAAAQDAILALTAAARVLQQHMSTDLQNASHAMDGWQGHHAETFTGGDLPWIKGESTRIVDGMLKLATTISSAADHAARLQRAQQHAN